MTILAPVIRYHGAGVLMQKPRSYAEVYNDLDGDIVNLFRVLQDPATRTALVRRLVLTPYSRAEFELSCESANDPIERVRRTIIRAQMGFGSAGATKGVTGSRIDTKRQYGTAQSLWAEYPDSLAAVGRRLSGVLIENRPAIEVITAHDAATTLHYVDPPYVHDTRYKGASTGRYYRHEMDDVEHPRLLGVLLELEGMVVLSGYPSELYSELLTDWRCYSTSARISAGRGTASRTECIWLNPGCNERVSQMGLDLGENS